MINARIIPSFLKLSLSFFRLVRFAFVTPRSEGISLDERKGNEDSGVIGKNYRSDSAIFNHFGTDLGNGLENVDAVLSGTIYALVKLRTGAPIYIEFAVSFSRTSSKTFIPEMYFPETF